MNTKIELANLWVFKTTDSAGRVCKERINSPTYEFGSSCRTLLAFTSKSATFRKQSEISQSNYQISDPGTRPRCLPCTLVQHLQEQVGRLRAELSDVARNFLLMEHEDWDLIEHEWSLGKAFTDLSLQVRQLLSDRAAPWSTKEAKSGVKLSKMNVATFDGNILNWSTFWQQFVVAIHSKAQPDDTEKLAYLKDVLKNGPARLIIESLTHDAECYKEAIDCLQKHYDQLRVIHWAHARAILDTPALIEGWQE